MAPRPQKQSLEDWSNFQQFLEDFQERFQANLHRTLSESIQQGVRAAFAANNGAIGENGAARANPREHHHPVFADDDEDIEDNLFAGAEFQQIHRQPHNRALANQRNDEDTRCEAGFKVELPDFHGTLSPEDLIDWITNVEELLEFKNVPAHRRVALVATRFKGRASTWWQQLKQKRAREGKEKISSWEKLKKQMRKSFLPYNYTRTLYNRLQNLRQGNRGVGDYAEEFFLLITLSEAHQRALSFEQQNKQGSSTWNSYGNRNRGTTSISGLGITNSSATIRSAENTDSNHPIPQDRSTHSSDNAGNSRPSRPHALRCYACGESGHRQMACPNQKRRGLLTEGHLQDQPAVYDDYNDEISDSQNLQEEH